MEKVIVIENLTKEYKLGQFDGGAFRSELKNRLTGKKDNKKFIALDGISLEIKKGEKVGIIGANGAGKSTLLKLISRITSPSDGCIKLKGRVSGMLEIGAGFNGELTGRENIYLNGAILGMSKAEIDGKLSDIIEFSECSEFIDTPVKRYSSGMFVKLAFSVAAHLDADIILMDEVLAVGDAAFQKKCVEKMNALAADKGKTILFVSHNMQTVKELCDRCVVLKKGRIAFDGATSDAVNFYLDNSFNMSKKNTEFEREEETMTSSLRIISTEIEKNHISFGESIELSLEFKVNEKVEQPHFAFTFINEENEKIATSLTPSMGILEKSEEIFKKGFVIDTKNLPCGKYSVSIAAVEPLSSKMLNRLDEVFGAFSVEIQGLEKTSAITTEWQKDLWGNAILSETKIKDC